MKRINLILLKLLIFLFSLLLIISKNDSKIYAVLKTQEMQDANHYYKFQYTLSEYNATSYLSNVIVYSAYYVSSCPANSVTESVGGTTYCKTTLDDESNRNPYIYYSNYLGNDIIQAYTKKGDGTNGYNTVVYFFKIGNTPANLSTNASFSTVAKNFYNNAAVTFKKSGVSRTGLNFGVQQADTYAVGIDGCGTGLWGWICGELSDSPEARDVAAGLIADDYGSIRYINYLNDGVYVLAGGYENYDLFLGARKSLGTYNMFGWVSIFVYDKTVPTISSVSQSTSNWTTGSVTLTVNASDATSGVYQYSFDNGSTWGSGNTQTYSSNTTVYIKVKDKAGNVSSTTHSITNIDKTAPTMSLFATSSSTLTSSIHYAKSMNIKIINSDTISGINSSNNLWCLSTSSSSCSSSWSSYTSNTSFNIGSSVSDTRYLLIYKATDNAGNTAAAPPMTYSPSGSQSGTAYSTWYYYTVRFDNTAPTMSLTATSSYSLTAYTNYVKSMDITITYSDTGGSGIDTSTIGWCLNPVGNSPTDCYTAWSSYTSGTSFNIVGSSSGSAFFLLEMIKDTAGNVATRPVMTYSNGSHSGSSYTDWFYYTIYFDRNVPTMSLTASSSNTLTSSSNYVRTMDIKVTNSDTGGSGINTYTYSWCLSTSYSSCSSSWTSYTSGTSFNIGSSVNGTMYLLISKAQDIAGNIASAPSMTYSPSGSQAGTAYSTWFFYTVRFDNLGPDIYIEPYTTFSEYTTVQSFEIYIYDSTSSISYSYYYVNDAIIYTSIEEDYFFEYKFIEINTTGVYYIVIESYDSLNNYNYYESEYIYVDNSSDDINISLSKSNTGGAYESSVSIDLNVSDSHSGFNYGSYTWTQSTSTPTSYSNYLSANQTINFSAKGDYYLHIIAYDYVGNERKIYYGPYKLDNDASDIQVVYGTIKNETWAKKHASTISVSDATSSISKRQFAWSKSTTTPSFSNEFSNGASIETPNETGCWYLHVKSFDGANNAKTTYTGPFYVDVTLPSITPDTTNSNKLKVNSVDSDSGISSTVATIPGTSYSYNCANNVDCYTLNLFTSLKLNVTSTDNVGNNQTGTVTLTRENQFGGGMSTDSKLVGISPGNYIDLKIGNGIVSRLNSSDLKMSVRNDKSTSPLIYIPHIINSKYGYISASNNSFSMSNNSFKVNGVSKILNEQNEIVLLPAPDCGDGNYGCSRVDTLSITTYPYGGTDAITMEISIAVINITPIVSDGLGGVKKLSIINYGDIYQLEPLSFTSYNGIELDNSNIETTITYNGMVVESIDTRKLGTYTITTIATDMYGVKSMPVIREVVVEDSIKPLISLIGPSTVIFKRGQIYNDQGASIIDNVDGELLIISNTLDNVNYHKVGSYQLLYYYIDSSGNISDTITRTIEIKYDYRWMIMVISSGIIMTLMQFKLIRRNKKVITK